MEILRAALERKGNVKLELNDGIVFEHQVGGMKVEPDLDQVVNLEAKHEDITEQFTFVATNKQEDVSLECAYVKKELEKRGEDVLDLSGVSSCDNGELERKTLNSSVVPCEIDVDTNLAVDDSNTSGVSGWETSVESYNLNTMCGGKLTEARNSPAEGNSICENTDKYLKDLRKSVYSDTLESINCEVSGKVLPQLDHLKHHLGTHTSKKLFKCDVCSKTFKRKWDFNCHLRTHTGEKPYKCEVCGKSFSQISGISIHSLTHTGNKKFKCDECGKCFARPYEVKVHTRSHTGEKPYKCDVCGKCFSRRNDIRKHLQMHARQQTLWKCEQMRLMQESLNCEQMHLRKKPLKCEKCGKVHQWQNH